MSLVGKLTVPKTLAGRALGKKTMSDDDDVGGQINPPRGATRITATADVRVTATGDTRVIA